MNMIHVELHHIYLISTVLMPEVLQQARTNVKMALQRTWMRNYKCK